MTGDALTLLCAATLAVDEELRRLRDERDAARAALLACAERLALVSVHLSRLAERPDRRDCR